MTKDELEEFAAALEPPIVEEVSKASVKPKGKQVKRGTTAKTSKPVKQSSKTVKKTVPAIDGPKKVAMTDTRKLTKKGEDSLRARWSSTASGGSRDSMMQGLIETARGKFGADRVFGSREELGQLAIGIPTPSLAFEYLIANDVFPLSCVMMLAGSWGSCKSALSYEFFRWFYELSGINVHIDTEDKFDADFACDIMRAPDGQIPIISNRAGSLEKMQQMLTYYLQEVQDKLIGNKENPGPGKTVPCCFCVDSLAGATSEEIQEKILKEGNANRMHPINALKNTLYLSGIKKQLENWPFTLLVVNHMKEKKDDQGNVHQYTLGGEAFNFHESFEIRNSVWKSKFKNAQFEGIGVKLHCAKNSFGPTGRRIKTRFLWWVEDHPQTGKPKDVFLWDWNWALCTLLNEMEGTSKIRLKDRDLSISCKSPAADVECLANMRALGMGKDEYLPFQEVGQMIQDNVEVSDRIRDALNIKRRYQLDRPYDDIVQDFKDSVE